MRHKYRERHSGLGRRRRREGTSRYRGGPRAQCLAPRGRLSKAGAQRVASFEPELCGASWRRAPSAKCGGVDARALTVGSRFRTSKSKLRPKPQPRKLLLTPPRVLRQSRLVTAKHRIGHRRADQRVVYQTAGAKAGKEPRPAYWPSSFSFSFGRRQPACERHIPEMTPRRQRTHAC